MKKGDMSGPGTLGAIAVVVFLVFLFFVGTGKSFGSWFSGVDSATDTFMKATLDRCKEQYDPLIHSKDDGDYDGDHLPDFCDNCPHVNNINTPDKDGDLFPVGCCGNDGKFNFLVDKNGGLERKNHKDVEWCGDKKEKDTYTEKPKHPVYNPLWS